MKGLKSISLIMLLVLTVVFGSYSITFADDCDYIVNEVAALLDFSEDGITSNYSYSIANDMSEEMASVIVQIKPPADMSIEDLNFTDSRSGNALTYTEQEGQKYLVGLDTPVGAGESFVLNITANIKIQEAYGKKFKVGITIPAVCGSVKMLQEPDSFQLTVRMPEDWDISSSFPTVYPTDSADVNEAFVSLTNVPGLFQAEFLTEPGGIKNDTLLNIAFPLFLLVGVGVVLVLVRVQIKHKEAADAAMNEENERKKSGD